jgi:hypothetical protein
MSKGAVSAKPGKDRGSKSRPEDRLPPTEGRVVVLHDIDARLLDGEIKFNSDVVAIVRDELKRGKRPSDSQVQALSNCLWQLLRPGATTAPPLISSSLRGALGTILREGPEAITHLARRSGDAERELARALLGVIVEAQAIKSVLPNLTEIAPRVRSNNEHFIWRAVFSAVNEMLKGAGRAGGGSGENTVAVKITVKIIGLGGINMTGAALREMLKREGKKSVGVTDWWLRKSSRPPVAPSSRSCRREKRDDPDR